MPQSSMITDCDRCVQIEEAVYINHDITANMQAAANIAKPMHMRRAHHNCAAPNIDSCQFQDMPAKPYACIGRDNASDRTNKDHAWVEFADLFTNHRSDLCC